MKHYVTTVGIHRSWHRLAQRCEYPHACKELMKNIVQDLIDGEWAEADSINFWTLDAAKWCECDNCKALGTTTDRNLLLVHRLDQEMNKAMAEGRLKRNVRIFFLAYWDVLEPPTRPLPPDFDYDNCIATYYPIIRCYVHTFADPACTEFNLRYQQNLVGWATERERKMRRPMHQTLKKTMTRTTCHAPAQKGLRGPGCLAIHGRRRRCTLRRMPL